jgi:hypothetical protein
MWTISGNTLELGIVLAALLVIMVLVKKAMDKRES